MTACFAGCTGRLFSGSSDRTIRVWSATSAPASVSTQSLATPSPCSPSAPLRPNSNLYSGSANGKLHMWALDTLKQVSSVTGHDSGVDALACNGQALVSGSADATIKIWNTQTRSAAGETTFTGQHKASSVCTEKIHERCSASGVLRRRHTQGKIHSPFPLRRSALGIFISSWVMQNDIQYVNIYIIKYVLILNFKCQNYVAVAEL